MQNANKIEENLGIFSQVGCAWQPFLWNCDLYDLSTEVQSTGRLPCQLQIICIVECIKCGYLFIEWQISTSPAALS